MRNVVRQLHKLIKQYDEFRIQSFDSSRLVLIGCWDLTYHHNIEVVFEDVSYIACASDFSAQDFRLATPLENVSVHSEIGETVFCFVSDERTFFITAQSVSFEEGLVLHYEA